MFELQPLAAPAVEAAVGARDVLEYAAVRLFVERAVAADRRFALTDGNAYAVAEVCRLLDGMPLALELAAACIPAYTPAQLMGMLDARFALLRVVVRLPAGALTPAFPFVDGQPCRRRVWTRGLLVAWVLERPSACAHPDSAQ